ncbi:unnamed protein product [Bursaphelenchus xylophilus]|uniref:(pine wood nematode) hypothetical protein n=1 Tax=Bursaphelenchus xylophilus TaxID=6326 RepID=A0A1I7RRQ9_BURXY|nr:unnamed protein product [Bursaphelenchus xylophilus]CAG9123537.1 unnamed protein product [Bursaphelenchus xylophilus]
MSKKTSPEEELEKQYREYKAQFEKWREANRGSEGSEGYIQYVKQFEKWERDVEARRRSVRAKSEQERRQQALQEQQKQHNEEEAAAKYAEQQKSYMAMHQKAMLEEERQRQQRQNPAQAQGHADETIKRGPHIQAEPQPLFSTQNVQRSALWGPDGADFPPTDPMSIRWGIRAAPPNFKVMYEPPPSNVPINPSWYLMKKMEDQGLFYGYNVNLNGVPEISSEGIPPSLFNAVKDGPEGTILPITTSGGQAFPPPMNRSLNVPPPPTDFSVPPPGLV